MDPYFGVLTHERFRRRNLTPASLDEFFDIGRRDVDEMLTDCRRHCGEISTARTLEFGCGVGRMLIPMSRLAERCVGVDVSDGMRAEAARNCESFGCGNVQLVKTLDEARKGQGTFSFIYSRMVLQHMDIRRGLDTIASLLASLDIGGCAALHVTYAHTKYRDSLGVRPPDRAFLRRIRHRLSRLSRSLRRREPQMEMNMYSMSQVLFLAHTSGVTTGGLRFAGGDCLGAILYLKRE